MPAGRPRLPDEIHKLRGTLRKDRHGDPKKMMGASGTSPIMPTDFTETQKKAWRALHRILRPLGLWSATFAIPVELLVRAYVRYLEVDADVRQHGAILTSPKVDRNGEVIVAKFPNGRISVIWERRTNPAQIEFGKMTAELRALCNQLGLDPSALAKLRFAVGDVKPNDDFLNVVG